MGFVLPVEDLDSGGVETQVCALAGAPNPRGHRARVTARSAGGTDTPLAVRASVEHKCLGGHTTEMPLMV